MTNEELNKWIITPPIPEDIKIKDGAKYIPYEIIVRKLNLLCDNNWGTYNFAESYVRIGKRILISGHVEVEVNYNSITRRLAGGANFILNRASNPHPTATVKSLAVMNAVKPLGEQFGWKLNPQNEEDTVKFMSVISVEKVDVNHEQERMKTLISDCKTTEELETYKLVVPKPLRKFYEEKYLEILKETP